jgi:hypothetical protein
MECARRIGDAAAFMDDAGVDRETRNPGQAIVDNSIDQ